MNLKSRKIISIALVFFMMLTILPLAPVTAHAAVGEIETITDEELLEVMEVDLRIGHEIIANSESTSFSKMSGMGWELKLSKQDHENRMQYYIVLHLYDYDVPDGYIDFMYDMKSSADSVNSVSFTVSVHGDCQVGFIRALTTDDEKVYGSSLDIIFGAGATLRTNQIYHRGTGQWGDDIELNLRGTPGEEPGILYTNEIFNSYYFIDWYHGSEPVTYANNLIIINYDTPPNGGPLFSLDEDERTYKVQFGERVDLFLNTRHGQFPIFGEYADETLEQTYQYIEDDGITAFSDLRSHIWLRENGLSSTEYTVGDSIDYYFFPELTMLDFLFKNGINEQFKGNTTSGFKVESSYELTNLSQRTVVASDTVVGAEEVYSYEKDNFVKVAGKNGEEYFTFETSGIYELRATVKLIHNGNVVDSVGKVYHFLVNDKPLVTPNITDQPESAIKVTDSHELSATATNAERARWYKVGADGNLTALETSFSEGVATTTIFSNNPGDRYYCAFWSVDNKIAQTDVVTVCFAPTVSSNGNVTVASGNTAFLKVTESGCGHYAAATGWYKNGVELTSGAKYYLMGTTLAVQNAAAEDAGTYTYKYVTEHGDEVTADVTLTVDTGSDSTTTISTFDIFDLENPAVLGTKADTQVSVPADAGYYVESITWSCVDSDGIITSSNGSVTIKLTPKEGYAFKNSGNINGTVNGITKAFSRYDGSSIIVVVDYNDTSSWKIVYPENDTVSISTDSLTFRAGTAANGQKVEGDFECTHSGLADTKLHHTGMKYAVYSIADNAMPAGLTLNADGTITGTPTTAGFYTVMVRADSVNASGTASNCSGLAVKAIEIVVEAEDEVHQHNWQINDPVVVTPATCEADGESKITCSGCTETVKITTPATGHDWGEWPAYMIPTCKGDPITITRTCANDSKHTESKTVNPIHMATEWSSDKSGHWKYCAYGCGTIVVDKEAHSYGGDRVYDICNYKKPSSGGSYGGGSYVAPDKDADSKLRIVMQINNKNILVNGKTMVNDVAPVIVGDRTLVPIRVVTELLGGSADWDNATRTVTLKIDGKIMSMTIGKEIPGFGTSAVIMNDRTYVPVRYVMEKLGAEVEWIGATRQIIIEK